MYRINMGLLSYCLGSDRLRNGMTWELIKSKDGNLVPKKKRDQFEFYISGQRNDPGDKPREN